jgi:hypothetical protein
MQLVGGLKLHGRSGSLLTQNGNNNARTTEIRLKELMLDTMRTTVSDGPQ